MQLVFSLEDAKRILTASANNPADQSTLKPTMVLIDEKHTLKLKETLPTLREFDTKRMDLMLVSLERSKSPSFGRGGGGRTPKRTYGARASAPGLALCGVTVPPGNKEVWVRCTLKTVMQTALATRTRADGKQLCCRFWTGTGRAQRPALAAKEIAIRPFSEAGTGGAQAGTTKRLPCPDTHTLEGWLGERQTRKQVVLMSDANTNDKEMKMLYELGADLLYTAGLSECAMDSVFRSAEKSNACAAFHMQARVLTHALQEVGASRLRPGLASPHHRREWSLLFGWLCSGLSTGQLQNSCTFMAIDFFI
jgi:hypothetical protein